jgi:uncharacterized protein Usg
MASCGSERELPARILSQTEKEKGLLQKIEAFVRIPDWRLTTAEILYHMPDHHEVLQTFVWQKLDRAPGFPELSRFLDFWCREIEGPLHSVRVASSALIRPAELRYANGQFTLH